MKQQNSVKQINDSQTNQSQQPSPYGSSEPINFEQKYLNLGQSENTPNISINQTAKNDYQNI